MTMYTNPMQSQNPDPHRLTCMQFKWQIRKGEISFLIQLNYSWKWQRGDNGTTLCHNVGGIVDLFWPLPSGLPP